jgi:hypothetical protein
MLGALSCAGALSASSDSRTLSNSESYWSFIGICDVLSVTNFFLVVCSSSVTFLVVLLTTVELTVEVALAVKLELEVDVREQLVLVLLAVELAFVQICVAFNVVELLVDELVLVEVELVVGVEVEEEVELEVLVLEPVELLATELVALLN